VAAIGRNFKLRQCPVIDRIDTFRKGGHAIWLAADGITIETVRDWQGERPWSPRIDSARPRDNRDEEFR
jgi:hypothetical protein